MFSLTPSFPPSLLHLPSLSFCFPGAIRSPSSSFAAYLYIIYYIYIYATRYNNIPKHLLSRGRIFRPNYTPHMYIILIIYIYMYLAYRRVYYIIIYLSHCTNQRIYTFSSSSSCDGILIYYINNIRIIYYILSG